MSTVSLPVRADCPDHPGHATYDTTSGFCTCGRAHRDWPTSTPADRAAQAVDLIREDSELLDRVRLRLDDVASTAFLEHGTSLEAPEAGAVIRDMVRARGTRVSRFTDWDAVGQVFLDERMAAKHDRARLACNSHGGPDHTCQDDPEVEADYRRWVEANKAGRAPARCDYCDTPGCRWQNHAEARSEVAMAAQGTLPGMYVDHA